jgi:hypothetical protein
MAAFSCSVGTRLEWRQPDAFHRFHELIIDGETQASLRFEKGCGTLARAEFGDSQWTFKRSGFWKPKVTVRRAGSEADLAVFTPRITGGGELAFTGGLRFQLESASFWSGEWAFETADGREVVRVHGPHGALGSRGEASLGLPAAVVPETPLLLMLIWYLLLLMKDDAGTAAVMAVCCG